LLVVIAIIALLVSILMPALSKARDIAKSAVCTSNLKNIHAPLFMYMTDSDGFLPGYNWDHGPGETTWSLEMYRAMGGKDPKYGDSADVEAALWQSGVTWNQKTWALDNPILICPNNRNKWSACMPGGSYGPNQATWHHVNSSGKYVYQVDTGAGYEEYYPTQTQYFNFGKLHKASDGVILSEMIYHGGLEIIDGNTLTGNIYDPANYPNDAWASHTARWNHPGGKVWSANSAVAWVGTSSYLFFDGHVNLRQLPPHHLGRGAGAIPSGVSMPTFRQIVGD